MIPDLYLKSLQIRNVATFDNQTVEFSPHFNAIVGETGSGKSLILDSLQLIFGGRADKKIVRKGCEFAMVEAIFHAESPDVREWLKEIGYPTEGDQIVVKRLVYPSSPSKAWMNYHSCSVSLLSSFSRRYIDLVGQFENQKLLSSNYLLKLLDQYAGISHKVDDFSQKFQEWNLTIAKLSESQKELTQSIQQEDFIRFQIAEIDELNPSKEDENELIQKKSVSLNHEKHQKVLLASQARLSGDNDYSILNQLNLLIKGLESFPLIKPSIVEGLQTAHSLLSETDYALGSIEIDAVSGDELDNIMERLDQYQKLKRKFGGDLDNVLSSYDSLKKSQSSLDQLQAKITSLNKVSLQQKNELLAAGTKLHSQRQSFSKRLSTELTKAVRTLNMSGATLEITANPCELNQNGTTALNFSAQTNVGEGFYSVQDIASGGELSRILLALRQVLSSRDSISVFLFDEIDAGVGGETALKIGKSLSSVSTHSQVIAITHLPQIAVHAQHLVHVSKTTSGSDQLRTLSKIEAIPALKHDSFIQSMTPLN